MINASFNYLQQMDGTQKEYRLPGAEFTLENEENKKEHSLTIRRFLDSDGDMSILILKTPGGTLYSYYSIRRYTLKECAKKMLAEIFGIRNSSALRNLKCNGDYFQLPILVSGEPATIIAVRYLYLKDHPEICPGFDWLAIESTKSYTDMAIESLKEGEHIIIYENYQYPETCQIYRFDSLLECKLVFDDICQQILDGVNDPEYEDARAEFPHGKNLDGPNPSFGDVAFTLIGETRTAKFTMVSSSTISQAA